MEKDTVDTLIEYHNETYLDLPKHTINFKDSKTVGYELIQMADIFSGRTRQYFEGADSNRHIRKLVATCPL